jgi:hypothetical protein
MVIGFYSQDGGHNFSLRVRWLITAAELGALPADLPWAGLDRETILEGMGESDVILSPQMEDLAVTSIADKVAVKLHVRSMTAYTQLLWLSLLFCRRLLFVLTRCSPSYLIHHLSTFNVPQFIYDGDSSPSRALTLSADVPPGALTCQYQLALDPDDTLQLDYLRLETANDLEGTASRRGMSSAPDSHSSLESNSLEAAVESSDDDDDNDDMGDATDEDEKRVVAEGEGSNLRTNISVGADYQAKVPAFQGGAYSTSRRPPKPMWKPNVVSQDDLSKFLEAASVILNEYLATNNLTTNDPYTPLPSGRAEEIMRANIEQGFLTASSMSTASVVAGSTMRNSLRKECDADSLFERLWECNCDATAALAHIQQEPTRYISTWSSFEKEMFNDSFRRHHGAVRKVAKSLAPFKSLPEVIDYQYRFKIPDQFRLYQERKGEIAMRIVECIDNRRVVDPTTEVRRRPVGSKIHWSETNASDLVLATEERKEKARQLMLDANLVLGKIAIGRVATAVKELNRSDSAESRSVLFSLLQGQSDLQRRFMEFLPKASLT